MTVAELTQLLVGTSITTLTLTTPTETITLRREPVIATSSLPGLTRQPSPSSAALSAPWAPGSSPGVTDVGDGTLAIPAPCSGMFLHRHPLRKAPMIQIGQAVQAGAVLGLLQVGPLLLHITAPLAGIVAAISAEGTVGYGTALVHLAEGSE